jgi:hypothetical protein
VPIIATYRGLAEFLSIDLEFLVEFWTCPASLPTVGEEKAKSPRLSRTMHWQQQKVKGMIDSQMILRYTAPLLILYLDGITMGTLTYPLARKCSRLCLEVF